MKEEVLKKLINSCEDNSYTKYQLQSLLPALPVVNEFDNPHRPLSCAVDFNYDTYLLLMQNGFDANTMLKISMYMHCRVHPDEKEKIKNDVMKLAFEYGADANSIIFFQTCPSVDELKLFLDHGMNPDKALKMLVSLFNSSWSNIEELFELVLEHGANPNKIESFMAPLSEQSLKLFFEHGFDTKKAYELLMKRTYDYPEYQQQRKLLLDITINEALSTGKEISLNDPLTQVTDKTQLDYGTSILDQTIDFTGENITITE